MRFSHVVFSSVLLACLSCTTNSSSDDLTLYNDCISTNPVGDVPSDLYTVQSPTPSDSYGDFSKSMTVYGITLVAKEDVSDDFLRAVGQTIVEIFPSAECVIARHELVSVRQARSDFD